MSFSENEEEMLESLWICREKTGSDLITPSEFDCVPSADDFAALVREEILEKHGDGYLLTKKGVAETADAIRRHRLAERLLTDILSVKNEDIHSTACQFEHHLHKGIDDNVCTLLGHPGVCPHGKPIPPGKCCKDKSRIAGQIVSRLADLKPNQGGSVAYLHTLEPKRAQMLISMGVVPGTKIKLLAGYPSFLFQLGGGQFAVDENIAGEIYVRVENSVSH